MLYPKVVVISTFQVFFVAFLLSYFKVELPLPKIDIPWLKGSKNEAAGETRSAKSSSPKPSNEAKIFTLKELSKYDGSKGSSGLYLALLGRVYDVSKGGKHYGPNGGYHFFAGKCIYELKLFKKALFLLRFRKRCNSSICYGGIQRTRFERWYYGAHTSRYDWNRRMDAILRKRV